jgi:biotin carboxyl carrier protein
MARIELESPVTGVVWKVAAGPGSEVAVGDPVVVIESMKMEIPVEATEAGTVAEVTVSEGDQVSEDDPVAVLETS